MSSRDGALSASSWRSIRCTPARDSLCNLVSSYRSSSSRSRFLPNYPNPVFLSQRDSKLLPIDVARMMGTGPCPESGTGRTAIAPQHASDVQQHDISLCNIIGLGSDYVYVPYSSRLYILSNPVGNVALVFMSLFVVYLMVVVGHNLQTVLGVVVAVNNPPAAAAAAAVVQKQQVQHSSKTLSTTVCIVGLLLLACFGAGPNVMESFVTVQDSVAFIAGTVHVAYYAVRLQLDSTRVNPVNPILSSIAICIQRIYGSAENPYSQTIIFMMLTWLMHKISVMNAKAWIAKEGRTSPQQQQLLTVRWWRCADVLADGAFLAVMLYAGVIAAVGGDHRAAEPSISAVQVVQGVLACMALNRALTSVHFANVKV